MRKTVGKNDRSFKSIGQFFEETLVKKVLKLKFVCDTKSYQYTRKKIIVKGEKFYRKVIETKTDRKN